VKRSASIPSDAKDKKKISIKQRAQTFEGWSTAAQDARAIERHNSPITYAICSFEHSECKLLTS
jgi:hypothetical protein